QAADARRVDGRGRAPEVRPAVERVAVAVRVDPADKNRPRRPGLIEVSAGNLPVAGDRAKRGPARSRGLHVGDLIDVGDGHAMLAVENGKPFVAARIEKVLYA